MYVDHWPYTDPKIKKLARKFSAKQCHVVRDIAGEAWHGKHRDCCHFEPRTVEDAIAFAITAVFEMSLHTAMSRSVH